MWFKPKSTNFGLGISIFQEPASLDNYKKALEIAFAEDTAVLVEEFISGTEYRFFILDGRCEAVLLRVAANVSVMANTPFVNWSLRKMPIHCEDVITAHHLKSLH